LCCVASAKYSCISSMEFIIFRNCVNAYLIMQFEVLVVV